MRRAFADGLPRSLQIDLSGRPRLSREMISPTGNYLQADCVGQNGQQQSKLVQRKYTVIATIPDLLDSKSQVETLSHCDSAAQAVEEAKALVKEGQQKVTIRDPQDRVFTEKEFDTLFAEQK